MSALSIQVPFPVFQDRDGQPLENGYVWIGEPNLNPQTNPVVAYYDEALTIVAAQPLRTLNGYISRAGSPAQVYVNGVDFSILVQDSKGSMVYNFPEGTGISPNAAGVVYDPAGTGAVATTVQTKLRESVSVEDFGAVGDGVTNDRIAINNACTSLGTRGGVVLLGPKQYLVTGGNLVVPSNVTIQGQSPQAGENDITFNTYSAGTVLLIDGTSGYTVLLNNYSSGIEACYIVKSGLSMTPTTAAELQTQIDSFAGIGVTMAANDARAEKLCIVGFATAIRKIGSPGYVRHRIRDVLFDCTNGIQIDLAGDLGDIYYCRGYPVYSAFRGAWVTNANNRRSGIGFYAPLTYDWGMFTNCNVFGYATGFLINDCNNITLTNCGADNNQSVAGTIGFSFTGACAALTLIGCKSTLTTGYRFNFTGHASLVGCSSWGSQTHVNVVAGDVDSYGCYWHYLAAAGATFSWTVGAGAGYVASHDDVFDATSSAYPGDVFSVNAAAQTRFRLFGIKLRSCTTTQIDQMPSDWIAWTPTITSGTGTLTTVTLSTANYQTCGKTVNFQLLFTITTNGTGATDIRVTLPLAVFSSGVACGRSSLTGSMLQGQIIASGLNQVRLFNYNNTYPGADGAQLIVSGTYQST